MEKVNYALPTSIKVNGTEYPIQSDYRAALDILAALADGELDNQDKAEAALTIFYPTLDEMPYVDYQEALQQCFWFLDCGERAKDDKQHTPIMSWSQDFSLIVAPVNRIAGCEVRALEYLHWWSFISYYREIGDCLFAQVVSIRDKKAHGKALDKQEKEFYRRNREMIDLKTNYTQAENDVLVAWGLKKG